MKHAYKQLKRTCWSTILTFVSLALLGLTNAGAQTFTIGNVTGQNFANSQPNVFGGWFSQSRTQFIIRKSELNAAGILGDKLITTISWNITNLNNAGVHQNFRIRMKMTAESVITSTTHDTLGLVQVFNPVNYQPVVGANTFTLNLPFNYIDTGNILIDVCHENPNNIYTNTPQQDLTTLSYNCLRQGWSDTQNGIICPSPTSTAIPTLYAQRPVTTLTVICPPGGSPMALNGTAFSAPTLSPTIAGATNQLILCAKVVTTNPGTPLAVTSLTFNTAGTTNPSNIANARVFFTGSNPNFSTATPFGTAINNPTGSFTFNGTATLVPVSCTGASADTNYFWLAYNIASNASVGNTVNATFTNATVGGVTSTPVSQSPASGRNIVGAVSGYVTIGTGGDYPTITAAANDISLRGIGGPVTILLTNQVYSAATGEIFPINIANVGGSGNPNRRITIKPAFGNTAHIIGNSTSIINIDNTKYVTIDGRDTNTSVTRSLIIENEATGSSSTVRFLNDAIGGTLVYTEIRSANSNINTTTQPVIGAVSILGTNRSIPFGNDSMRISNNYFTRSTTATYTLGISVDGQSLVAQNNNINIDSNNFNGCVLTGIMVTGNNTGNGDNFNIRYNNFYDTSANNASANARVMINFIPGTASNNNFIGYNNIGGNQPLATAGIQKWSFATGNTGSFTGIRTSVGPTSGVIVRGNVISNFEFLNTTSFAPFNGINSQSGVHTIDSNLIGSTADFDNIRLGTTGTHVGIAISFPSQDYTVRANTIANIHGFTASTSVFLRGITYGGSNNTVNIENNVIKSLFTASTSTSSTTSSSLIGILVTGSSNAQFIRNNQIGGSNPEDSLSTYNVSGGRVVGIAFSSGINIVENNAISNLRNRSTTSTGGSTTSQIIGISASSFTAGGVVRNNTINNLRGFGVGSTGMVGILANSGSTTFNGNNIYDLVSSSNNTLTAANAAIVGINIVTSGQIFNVFNNNIYEFNAITSAGTSIVGISTVNSSQNVINGNTIRDLRSNSTSSSAITGIINTGFGLNQIMDGNTIHSLVSYNTTAATIGITGINASYSTTISGNSSSITRNNIHSFNVDATSTTLANIFGITPSGNLLIANNAVRLGRDTAGVRLTRAANYAGIRITSGGTSETRIYHNNIVVDANPVAGAGNSFALELQTVNTLPGFTDVKNNILVNSSENGSATGNHFVTSVPTLYTGNLRMNYNIYQTGVSSNSFAGRRGLINYATMQALKAGYLLEGTSTNTDNVAFVNRNGAFNAVDLHLNTTNIAEGGGDPAVAAFVSVDMDSSLRSGLGAVDIGSDAGNFTLAADSIAPEITFTRINNGPAINRTITATIIDKYGVYLVDSMPRIYFNKNNGPWFSNPGTLVSGNQFNGTWQFTVTGATMGGVALNDIVRYFIVAKDSLGGNINSEPMFASGGIAGINVFPATPAQYTITDPIATTITVGASGLYPTLTDVGGAFEAINNSVLQGNTTIELAGNITEPGTVQLNQWNELGVGGYTLTIRPQSTAQIIISGNIANANGLIRFNGISRLNLLGYSAAGTVNDTSLVVRTSSASTPAIGFINGGSADTIRGVIFEGRTTSNAVVFLSGSTILGGLPLSNITFRDNMVRQDMTSPTTFLPSTAILITGASPNFNNNIRIVNNAIYNFTSTGISASAANGGDYVITNNHFFYDATATASSHTYVTMQPGNTSNGNIVSNNWMGGRARFAGGPRLVYTGTITGISLSTGLTTGTQVNNNVFANLTAGTGFTGINVLGTSAIYQINNNRIGSVDSFTTIIANGAFRFTGINSTASGNVTIENDSILNIYHLNTTSSAAITGINVGSGFSNVTNINNNLVRGLFCNAANTSTTTASAIMGICVTSGSLAQNITNNRIQTLINTNNTASHSIRGIIVSSGANNINNNVVYGLLSRTTNINTNSTASGLAGIAMQSSTSGTQNIIGNTVDSIYYTGTSGTQTIGIMANGPGFFNTHNITVSNNIVRNMNTTSSAIGTLSAAALVGIHYNNANTTGNYNVNFAGNRISVLNHLSATSNSSIVGLLFANSTALVGNNSNVNGNFIHSFRSDATAGIPVMVGIGNINGFATYTNNMIRLGIDSGANLYSNPRTITGILQATGTQCRYYHNTIYISGSPSIGSANTQGYWAQAAINSGNQNDFRNNIVVNAVANTGTASGINYAVILQDSLRHIFNYNLYHTPNNFTGRINSTNTVYRLLEDSIWSWKAVTGFDMASGSGDPLFTADANGVADVASLAVASSNNIERSGDPSLTSVANDFFGNSRSANSPSDIGAHAGNFTLASDLFPPAISYTVFNNTGNTTATRILANVTITDNNGVPTTGTTRPQLLYSKNGTTWFTAPAVNISGTPSNFTASFNLDQLQLAPLSITDSVFYYVIAQDNASNTISNAPFAVAGSVNLVDIYNHPARPNYYKFLPVIPANTVFQVGNGQPYPTLTGTGGFFEFINSRTLGGNITAEVTSDITEPGTVALNAFAEDGVGGYELTIRPTASTTSAYTLEGTTTGTNPLVVLNGTARVKITGVPTGGNPSQKLLRFRNNNNGAPTIQMQNGAIANRLNNLLVEGGNTNTTSGVVTIMVTLGNTVPCSFDTISNCVIGNNTTAAFPAGIPNACIYADGQPNVFNNNCVISGNELYNFLNTGFRCNTNTGDGWQVLNNSVYNNLPISVTTVAFQPIDVFSGINGSGHTVQGNFVGGSGPLCSGVWNHTGNTGLNGIRLNSGNGATSFIRNNVIQNLNFNIPVFNSFIGIVSTNGNVTIGGTPAQGNLIGSTTNPSSFIHNGFSGGTGINYQGTGNINISGNTVCGMVVGSAAQTGAFTGISITNGNLTGFTDNVVGSTTMANAITYIGSGTLTGITLSVPSTYAASYTATNNTVSNLTATGTQTGVTLRGYTLQNSGIPVFTNNTASNLTSASSNVSTTFGSVTGIAISLGSLGTVANNTVSAIRATNTSAATNATGILLTGGQSVVINANRVTDITNASTATTSNPAATATGIQIGGGTTNATVSNNQVSLGSGQTTNTQFAGLWVTTNNSGFLLNAFNNSIVITGAAASGNNNSYALIRGNNTGSQLFTIMNLRNNILANNRTGGSGTHYAISNQSTSPSNTSWTNITSQYNLMVTANPNAMAEWGVTANNYSTWLTNSTSDNWSYYMQAGTGAGQLNLTNLFTNIANGNLTVQSANAEAWYVYGKGIAGNAVNNLNTDYAGVSRGTTLGYGISIGSTQLNTAPSVLPPAAIASAAPSVNGTSIYRFASRPVLTLNWGASVPASATLYNYAGVNPPNALGGNNLNQYARVAVTGGTAPYNYTATVHFDPALIGGITSQGNMRVANENTGSTSTSPVWQLQTVSTVNLANSTVTSGAIASSLSDFFFSANENTAPPTISAFTPAAREVGGNVSIRGSLFTGASAVSFNGVNQPSYTVVNDTLITTTVPVGATTGPVSVTNVYGVGTSATNFTVIPAPTVTSISTTTGTFGTAVTITGTGFTWATQVQFNTTNATFTVVNNTTITTTVPVGASTGVITVTNPAGSASSLSLFNVIGTPTITGFTPASGQVGTTVTITGTNFQAITGVTFNNVAASYTVASATSITAIVPSAAITGAIRVTNGSGTAVSATNYTVLPVPTVDAFTPSSGGIGTVVTITGTNFANIDSVEFGGGVNATFTVVSSTQINATVANGSISGVITVYRNGVAPVSSTGSFTVIPNLVVSTAQSVSGTYNNVTITATGVATLNGTLNALGNVTVESGGALNLGTEVVTGNGNFTAQSGSTLRVGATQGISSTGGFVGNIQVNGTRAYNGKVEYNGLVAQTTGNGLAAGVDTLIINNPNGVTLTDPVTVNNHLVLGNGNLNLGIYNVTASGTIVANASGYVSTNGTGVLRRTVANNGVFVNFPVGNQAFTPASLQLGVSSTADVFGVRVAIGVLTGATSGSTINQSIVNRTWFVSENVTGGSNLTANFTWDDSLEINAFNRANCAVAIFNGIWNRGAMGAATGANPYSRSVSGVTAFSAFAVGDINATSLPVQLISFNATKEGKGARINWSTASEKNNGRFEVQRSTDGVNFETFELVKGAGNTNRVTKYTVYDNDAFTASNAVYYRLIQIDFDGTSTYSEVVTLNNEVVSSNLITEVYPNPFNNNVQLSLNGTVEGNITVDVTDALGRSVLSFTKEVKATNNVVTLDELAELADGAYIMNVKVNGMTQRVKLIKSNN